MFPEIKNIDDVLPYIEGEESFKIIKKDGYTVIDYVIETPNTFPPLSEGIGAAIRRECRGICFDESGKIVRRGLQKFHNLNQTDEAQVSNIDWSKHHTVMDKMDGSLIFNISLNGNQYLGTRKGRTDYSAMADKFVSENPQIQYMDFIKRMDFLGFTVFFEFFCKDNIVVLDYGKPHMTLLAARSLEDGKYLSQDSLVEIASDYNIPCVEVFDVDLSEPTEFLKKAKGEEGKEGYVIRFDDGYTIKVKGDWYVGLHKIVDSINSRKNLVKLILDKSIDDIIPALPKARVDYINDFQERFFKFLEVFNLDLYLKWQLISADVEDKSSRKDWAVRIMQEDKYFSGLFFKLLDRNPKNEDEVLSNISELVNEFTYSKTNKEIVFESFVEKVGFEL